jgi:hypothetical protein
MTRISLGRLPKGFRRIQGLSRLDHHTHAEWMPSLERGNDAGPHWIELAQKSS